MHTCKSQNQDPSGTLMPIMFCSLSPLIQRPPQLTTTKGKGASSYVKGLLYQHVWPSAILVGMQGHLLLFEVTPCKFWQQTALAQSKPLKEAPSSSRSFRRISAMMSWPCIRCLGKGTSSPLMSVQTSPSSIRIYSTDFSPTHRMKTA